MLEETNENIIDEYDDRIYDATRDVDNGASIGKLDMSDTAMLKLIIRENSPSEDIEEDFVEEYYKKFNNGELKEKIEAMHYKQKFYENRRNILTEKSKQNQEQTTKQNQENIKKYLDIKNKNIRK